jgi:hypothetical protein
MGFWTSLRAETGRGYFDKFHDIASGINRRDWAANRILAARANSRVAQGVSYERVLGDLINQAMALQNGTGPDPRWDRFPG